MKILHYSLGFPPYRSGGLTIFCTDLMWQQSKQGHDVALLWPGQIHLLDHRIQIKKRRNYIDGEAVICSYEIINPLPISYDEGIKDIDAFICEGDMMVYLRFLREYKPDVIHIHTLMGLHKAFLVAAKELNIRLVFTAHDFFPICPKVTLFKNAGVCRGDRDCEACYRCNQSALSMTKIKILQSAIYRKCKNLRLVKRIRRYHRNRFLMSGGQKRLDMEKGDFHSNTPIDYDYSARYRDMRRHFEGMLQLMDVIHFNSELTKHIYQQYWRELEGVIIPVSHKAISDNKKNKKYNKEKIRIRYLGPCGEAKGFYLLQEALDMVWKERQDIQLDVHFTVKDSSPYIVSHERYRISELDRVFDETDILVAPSRLYETFGFTVLEALSYGVPVAVSENVGAVDILTPGGGVVLEDNVDAYYQFFCDLDENQIEKMNQTIVNEQKISLLADISSQIESLCYII